MNKIREALFITMNLEQILNKIINWVTTEGIKLVIWLFLLWIGWKLARKLVNIMNKTLEKRNVDATVRSFFRYFCGSSIKRSRDLYIPRSSRN